MPDSQPSIEEGLDELPGGFYYLGVSVENQKRASARGWLTFGLCALLGIGFISECGLRVNLNGYGNGDNEK